MQGVRFTKDGTEFVIVGVEGDGRFVAQPVEFGPCETFSAADLAAQGVTVIEPERISDENGWRKFGTAFMERLTAARRRRPIVAPTPEELLSGAAADHAQAQAAAIFKDGDRLAAFEIGELDVAPEVARELDALIARRNGSDKDAA